MQTIKVVELGGNVSAAYTTKLLTDSGAQVVKLELPTGDPLRQRTGFFQALNLNKESVICDYPTDATTLQPWLTWADIVVHDFPAHQARQLGLDLATLSADHPTLVTCAITPFGHTGPYAEYAATELTLANAGGWANLCPATHPDPDLPPLKVYGDHCQMMAAVSAAATTLACYRAALSSGAGEFIDFSTQAYVASVLEAGIPAMSYREEVVNRTHPRSLIPWRTFQAKDAPVFIVCIEQDQWERLVEFMGNPDWASLPTFVDQPARQENQDLVHTLVQEFVSEWQALDLYHAAQAKRICVAPVMDLVQLAASEHLDARDFFVDVGDTTYMSSAILSTTGRTPIASPAPPLGASRIAPETDASRETTLPTPDSPSAPLAGIRVLDLTWAWAGPFCSMNLAHLGAEVIRIESSMRADLYRRLPIFPVGVEEGLNCSGMFNQWNQGKASVTINLATAEGINLVKQLIAEADVVVQNFATGVLDRMGLGYPVLKELNPGIILASISGYGQSGPFKDYMGYGPAIPPLTGLSAATGFVGGEAEEFGLSMPDPTAGITAAFGIVSALLRRDQTGQGDHLDVSLWEATAVLHAEAWMNFQRTHQQPLRQGNRSEHMVPHGVFACQPLAEPNGAEGEANSGNWVSIACRSDAEWATLAQLMELDRPEWAQFANRLADIDAVEVVVTTWTQAQDRWQITEILQTAGIPCFPSLTTADIIDDPHLNARGFIERLTHPEVGQRDHTGIPWRLCNRPNGVRKPAPCIDADTDNYMRELLALDSKSIAALRASGTIGC